MKKIAAALALSALSLTASATDSGVYIGISAGQSEMDTGVVIPAGSGARLDESDSAWKLFGGYRFNENFAVELHYADLGEARLDGSAGDTFTYGGTTFAFIANGNIALESDSLGVSGLVTLPLGERFGLFAKAGLQRWDVKGSAVGLGAVTLSVDGTDPFFGVGASYDFTDDLGVRAEWERYDFDGTDVDLMSVGLSYSF